MNAEFTSNRNIGHDSKWTSIYWSIEEGKMLPVVRLTPDYLELEKLGFPHGLSVSPPFENEEQAHAYAARLDAFFEAMVREHEDPLQPLPQKPRALRETVAGPGLFTQRESRILWLQWALLMVVLACLNTAMPQTGSRTTPWLVALGMGAIAACATIVAVLALSRKRAKQIQPRRD